MIHFSPHMSFFALPIIAGLATSQEFLNTSFVHGLCIGSGEPFICSAGAEAIPDKLIGRKLEWCEGHLPGNTPGRRYGRSKYFRTFQSMPAITDDQVEHWGCQRLLGAAFGWMH